MVVDSSAFLATLLEADGDAYLAAMLDTSRACASALTVYETRIVLTAVRRGRPRYAARTIDSFLDLLEGCRIEVVAFDAGQAVLAHGAHRRFGKGVHPAALNLADCAAYALARHRGEPLLFKGSDFARTDIEPALRNQSSLD